VSRTPVFVLCFTLAGAAAAHAQIIDSRIGRTRDPIAWTSLSIGWFRQNPLCDQETNACWDFGSAPQWRGTLEFPMGRGATVGGAATIARVPLVYNGGIGANSCVQCDADANIVQYLANVRIGGGSGFHQVIDLNAGTTVFSNFRSTTGTRLGGKAVTDWSFSVGYGFGYSLSPRMQIMLLQEYGLVIHARQSGSAERTAQQSTIRIGGRVGLGDR
jgi:hypothetical protein